MSTLIEHENIHRLTHEGRQITLIGTAHISQASADLVAEVIEAEKPETVAVELCDTRLQTLREKEAWRNMDIVKVIRQKKTFVLFINFLMSAFQRKMANQFDVQPGLEMKVALEKADEQEAEVATIDRDVRTTLSRVWGMMGFWTKIKLFNQIVMGLFDDEEELTKEQIEDMKAKGALELLLDEMGQHLPDLKHRLIDERDLYMIQKIRQAPGDSIVAVVGAGHVPGMLKHWDKSDIDLDDLDTLPPKSKITLLIQWGLPLAIIGLMVAGFIIGGSSEEATQRGLNGVLAWLLFNGVLSGLGVLIARGHVLTILAATIAAPITSLNPLMAAGYVAGLVEAWIRKPKVKDFEALPDDILSAKGWFANQVTRILLVVILANLGSTLGTFLGGSWLLGNLR